MVLGGSCTAVPASPPRVAGDTGAFAVLAGGDTIVVDEYVRTPRELRGTLRLFSREPGGTTARATYSVAYGDDGRPAGARLEILQVSPAGVEAPASRQWRAAFRDDGTVVEVETGAGRQVDARPGRDVLPLFGPSVAMLAAVLHHARVHSLTRVPLFHVAAGGRVDTARIRWHLADSATLTVAGASGSYRIDPSGRLLGGMAEGERLRTVRLR